MSVFRTVFFGTPEFACESLQALLNDEHYKVVGVVSQPNRPAGRSLKEVDTPVKALALQHGLEVFSPLKINDEESIAKIKSWKAEVGVVVAYGQILSQALLDLFPQRIVNVHGSLLPKWRGAAPIQRAIAAGDSETGVALQVMVKKMDAGPVLGVRKLSLDGEINALELHDRLKVLGGELLHVELMDYLRGNLMPSPQDEGAVTVAPKIEKAEAQIDWQESALAIDRKARGFILGPGVATQLAGKNLKILKSQVVAQSRPTGEFGEILTFEKDIFEVQCGEGKLRLLLVQPESKSAMPAADFIRGHKLSGKTILGKK